MLCLPPTGSFTREQLKAKKADLFCSFVERSTTLAVPRIQFVPTTLFVFGQLFLSRRTTVDNRSQHWRCKKAHCRYNTGLCVLHVSEVWVKSVCEVNCDLSSQLTPLRYRFFWSICLRLASFWLVIHSGRKIVTRPYSTQLLRRPDLSKFALTGALAGWSWQ